MKKGVTIKDIARRLNMSISTVSKALNNNPVIAVLTRERVQKFARECNYIPNEAARHFQQNKSMNLGVIMPDLLDQFYVLAVNGIEDVAYKTNYNVIVTQSHERLRKEEMVIENMIRNRVDGVIIAVTKNTTSTEKFKRLLQTGIPVVFLSRSFYEPAFDYVCTNNEDGAMKAMKFLFGRGHRRIAHLMGPKTFQTSYLRLDGYKKALRRQGIGFSEELVEEVDLTPGQTIAAVDRLMQLKDPPTAFFTFKNYISLDVIRHLNKNFPERAKKIDVVGFGNLPLLQHLDHKPAASIDENSYQMGVKAAQRIFRNIQLKESGEDYPPCFIRVPCTLVVH